MALWSWSNLYNYSVEMFVEPEAMTVFEKLALDCIDSLFELIMLDAD